MLITEDEFQNFKAAHLSSGVFKLLACFLIALAYFVAGGRFAAPITVVLILVSAFGLVQLTAVARLTQSAIITIYFLTIVGSIEAFLFFPLGTILHYQSLRALFAVLKRNSNDE